MEFRIKDVEAHTIVSNPLEMRLKHVSGLSMSGTARRVQYKPKTNSNQMVGFYGGFAPTTGSSPVPHTKPTIKASPKAAWRSETSEELMDRLLPKLRHKVEWERAVV